MFFALMSSSNQSDNELKNVTVQLVWKSLEKIILEGNNSLSFSLYTKFQQMDLRRFNFIAFNDMIEKSSRLDKEIHHIFRYIAINSNSLLI